MALPLSRRAFLGGAAGAAAALTLSFPLPTRAARTGPDAPTMLTAYLRIESDGSIHFLCPNAEMGQGVFTAEAQLIAEELGVATDAIQVEAAPSEPVYALPIFGILVQQTGGSLSVRIGFETLRRAGASAREMLRAAAADRWGVPLESCLARDGAVHHVASGRYETYGALASDAAKREPPENVPLKPRAAWTEIGRSVPRNDLPDKVTGAAIFGIDIALEDALVATIRHSPAHGGSLRAVDPAPALAVAGVHQVVPLDHAVAVVAESYWPALKGARALRPDWDPGPNAGRTTETIRQDLLAGLDLPAEPVVETGDVADALARAPQRIEMIYEVPLIAHFTMEPMNATARVDADGAEIWAPCQSPTAIQIGVGTALGLSPDRVRVHTTLLGGGFGRRGEYDYAVEAALVARAVGRPVKLIWPREEDVTCDLPGGMVVGRMRGGLDEAGLPVAWETTVVAPPVMTRLFPPAAEFGIDVSVVHGLAEQSYRVAHRRTSVRIQEIGLPAGFWRAVGHRHNAFFQEGFIDEVAVLSDLDPFALRARLIGDGDPAMRRVLSLLRDRSGWDRAPFPGRVRGLAINRGMGSIVGHVVELSVEFDEVRVHRVTCAIDCGPPVNPDIIRAQMEGSIVDGINMAFNGGLTVHDGQIEQSQFHDLDWIGIGQVPEIDVHIVMGDSPVGGVGEPGLPPVAPALAAAIFRATGTRLRRMPFRAEGFVLA